jgi:hypothetical protein
MKKLLFLFMLSISIGFAAHAQEKVEVKKTTTPVQKVANPFRKNKRYKGYKVKSTANGVTHVKKVDQKHGTVETKVHD